MYMIIAFCTFIPSEWLLHCFSCHVLLWEKMRGKKKYSVYWKLAAIALLTLLVISGVIAGNSSEVTGSKLLAKGDYVKYIPEKQNPVDENAIQQVIYVDTKNPNSSDSNPGTEKSPLKTINQAAQIALKNYQNNIGTKTIVYPGIYRESIKIIAENSPLNVPIIFEAKEAGSVIVSGSDRWQNWQILKIKHYSVKYLTTVKIKAIN